MQDGVQERVQHNSGDTVHPHLRHEGRKQEKFKIMKRRHTNSSFQPFLSLLLRELL